MRHLLIPQTKEQAEEFLRLAEVEASKFGVSRTLPKDVEDFIAGNACSISVKDEYGDTHYGVDSIDVDDLRAWMSGHVRVPVEFVDDAMCRTCYTHAAYMTNPCQWCIDREAMLDGTKEQS